LKKNLKRDLSSPLAEKGIPPKPKPLFRGKKPKGPFPQQMSPPLGPRVLEKMPCQSRHAKFNPWGKIKQKAIFSQRFFKLENHFLGKKRSSPKKNLISLGILEGQQEWESPVPMENQELAKFFSWDITII